MAKLSLVKTIREFNRKELEYHIEAKRQRRMRATILYHEGKAGKYKHQQDEVNAKFLNALGRLGKKLELFDRAYDNVHKELIKLGEYEAAYEAVQILIDEEEEALR